MTAAQVDTTYPRLAKYELLEEIGCGGMATVYRARDPRLLREVAVKVLHRHLRENREIMARFVSEARAVAKLRHPNIVEVYDVSDESEVERYLVVELLRGASLRTLLADHPNLPPEIGAAIGIELAGALAHAHAAGIVHRDVKPENVLVETGGEGGEVKIKLTDFGIAKILDAQGVTSTGQVLGSPAHMAPEQIEGGEVDERADVFGLGVLLYELFVGHLPFEGANPAQVLRRVLDGIYAPADNERATVGQRWARILDRALAREPADRFSSVQELEEALRAELEALGISDPRAELRAYFANPDGYAARHTERLVRVLTERGERACKAGDRLASAADFNRALAYAPDDPALLKQVVRLSRGTKRRRALALVAVALGVSGAVAAAVLLRTKPAPQVTPPPAPRPTASAAVPPAPVASAVAAAPPSAMPAPTASAPATTPIKLVIPRKREVVEVERPVRFELNPKGAWVSIGSGAPEDLFGQSKLLPVGKHRVTLTVPNSSCCTPTSHVIEVVPGEGTQRFGLSVSFRDAKVTTQNAPEGAVFRCPALRLEGPAGRTFSVKMTSLEIAGTCFIEAPSHPMQTTSVTLRAGETTTIPWSLASR